MANIHTHDGNSAQSSWSVAIFAAREQPSELMATINAIVQAASEPTIIDVMVNGNPNLATEITKHITVMRTSANSPAIRVWSIPLGGKAHAWNQYVHHVWPGTELAFFVDGYVLVKPNTFQLLAIGMSRDPNSLAGTGVPSSGRTALQLREVTLKEGELHGNVFALKEVVMNDLRKRKFRLPLGLYGFDTVLGAVLGFGLDPSENQWNARERIFVHPDVTWTNDEKKWWRYSDVKTQFNRILNNGLRVLVVQATKYFFVHQKLPPEQLPRTIEDFVLAWVNNCPDEAGKTLLKSPLSRLALNKLRKPRDWSAAEQPPKLIYASQSSHIPF